MAEKKILIADDEPAVQLLLEEMLKDLGYSAAGLASNGNEAVELYKSLHPDLVIMDTVMPDMDGLKALQHIIAYDPKAKIIMLTAMLQMNMSEKFMSLGVKNYLIKPFTTEELKEKLILLFKEE